MKLLLITQVLDTEHPILGFFHRWIVEFAKHCDHVHVIALQVGTHNLPANVTVHSLGKEEGKSKVVYLWRFYLLIWSLRKEYDAVFVHMNQIYVILGWKLWWLLRKKVGLWYAHGAVPPTLRLAVPFVHHVFTSTEQGLQLKTAKRRIVGQGIDTEVFLPGEKHLSDTLRLITVGRISISKNIGTLLHACALLKKAGRKFHFSIVGVPTTPAEVVYEKEMKSLVQELGLTSEVTWQGAVPNHQLPQVLRQADVFIHDGTTNSLDKALVEASLCGCLVVSSNPAYRGLTESLAPECLYEPKNAAALAVIIQSVATGSVVKNDAIEAYFRSTFSISNLVSAILARY